ncbi:MAG: hypothetical protein GY794_13635, partial [bacterium]|nr:hypothetical protein [bacterium]
MVSGTLRTRPGRIAVFAGVVALCVMCVPIATHAAGKDAPATFGQVLSAKVSAFEKTIGSGARVGVSVVNLASGKATVAKRANELFIPASNQKLLSSAFALHALGGGYKFTTELYITRSGDIVVYGDFDPTLGDPDLASESAKNIYSELDRWAAAVKKHLGDKAPGKLFVSGGSMVYRPGDWKTSQNHRHYQAPAGRLNFHRNCFAATFKVADGTAKSIVTPKTRFITVRSSVRVGKKHVWSLRPSAGDAELNLRGTIRSGSSYPQYVASNNPPMLFARVLA